MIPRKMRCIRADTVLKDGFDRLRNGHYCVFGQYATGKGRTFAWKSSLCMGRSR